jgi:hypothetical protein
MCTHPTQTSQQLLPHLICSFFGNFEGLFAAIVHCIWMEERRRGFRASVVPDDKDNDDDDEDVDGDGDDDKDEDDKDNNDYDEDDDDDDDDKDDSIIERNIWKEDIEKGHPCCFVASGKIVEYISSR